MSDEKFWIHIDLNNEWFGMRTEKYILMFLPDDANCSYRGYVAFVPAKCVREKGNNMQSISTNRSFLYSLRKSQRDTDGKYKVVDEAILTAPEFFAQYEIDYDEAEKNELAQIAEKKQKRYLHPRKSENKSNSPE